MEIAAPLTIYKTVKSLQVLCFETVRLNLDDIKHIHLLPAHLQVLLLKYLLKQRRWGCKAISEENIVEFFTPTVPELDLSSLWLGSPKVLVDLLPSLFFFFRVRCRSR